MAKDLLATDGTTETEVWKIVWFPPQGDRAKTFSTEAKARRFAAREEVAEWNPLMEHVVTVSMVSSEIVPL